ncbi:SpoIIE family protein phosphatase [Streptomyces gobiensis]|uniref:SpoIIE family protein phosphatase n=1 Tax=Streptomyces gobiensis TaxID=2875706 RepID=UPI001E562B71|nr:SpoIIE family protein phosphatase [Streptomyces gobiensis]UGY90312.1 SpoIIE family protein phosphatase [Streptomyces gobiensis]
MDALGQRGQQRPRGGAASGELSRILAKGLVKAVRAAGGYGGGVFIRSRDGRSLVLASLAGVPRSLLRSWWRIPVSGGFPAATAYRTARSVYLTDAGERMRRFPQFATILPYPFAYLCSPIRAGNETVGVVFILRVASKGADLTVTERRRLRGVVNRLGAALAAYAAQGRSLEHQGDPVAVRLPTDAGTPVRIGLFDWELTTGLIAADDETCAIFGIDPAACDGTVAQLTARVVADDVHELQACARDAADNGRVLGRRFRVLDGEGRPRPVELWGRLPEGQATGARRHLVGAVVDLEQGVTAAEASERLPDGVFSLDQDGRLTYANHRLEMLLGIERENVLGRHPWEFLPWLSDPAYEDRYRAAMLSQEPTSFVVRGPAERWLAFFLYPDVHGLTGTVVPTQPPEEEEPTALRTPAQPPPALARPGALYHVVHMASVLTKAVTVREVCDVVADQLLPAFGGHQLAIYMVRERRMFLARQLGYPEGFLNQFEGVPLDAPLPGVQALTHGAPMFFDSPQQLSAAYPGIPLDHMGSWAFLPLIASGRQVGSCILGFAASRTFSAGDRAALTALGGLVAQALERARLYDAEFTLARGLQHGLLPHRLPDIDGVVTVGRYLPGTQGMEIGGDWYDVIATGRGVALAIGDVEGHNVAAAAIMGQLRSAVSALATSGLPPDEVVARTNHLLAELDPGLFATCCYVEISPATGHAQAVRAGHPPPLLRHPDGHTEALDLAGGTLLGVDPEAEYPVTRLNLPPGSVLALYTDGLVEQPGRDIDHGIDVIRSRLAHSAATSLQEMADRLVQEARRTPDRPDDVALLLMAYTPRGDGP